MPMNFMVKQMASRSRADRIASQSESVDKAIDMYKRGETWTRIATETGLKTSSINYHLRKRGIPRDRLK